MDNPVKKAFYLGVCAAAHTKHFLEEEVKRLLDAGHIDEKEGKKIVEHSMKKMKKDAAHMHKVIHTEMKAGLKSAKPHIHEGVKIAKDIASDLVKEAHTTVVEERKRFARRSGAAKKAAVKVKKKVSKVKGRVEKTMKTKARKVAKKVKAKVPKKVAAKVKKVAKKVQQVKRKLASKAKKGARKKVAKKSMAKKGRAVVKKKVAKKAVKRKVSKKKR